MKTKPKLMVCALIFVSGAILNLFFSTAVHGLLTREITRLSLLPIGDCLASLFSNRQHMMLYLCLQGFVSVLAVMFFLTNMRPYESDLDTITPEIQTPRAVGQYRRISALLWNRAGDVCAVPYHPVFRLGRAVQSGRA